MEVGNEDWVSRFFERLKLILEKFVSNGSYVMKFYLLDGVLEILKIIEVFYLINIVEIRDILRKIFVDKE